MIYKCNEKFTSELGTEYNKEDKFNIFLHTFNTNYPHLVVLTDDESCFLNQEELDKFTKE